MATGTNPSVNPVFQPFEVNNEHLNNRRSTVTGRGAHMYEKFKGELPVQGGVSQTHYEPIHLYSEPRETELLDEQNYVLDTRKAVPVVSQTQYEPLHLYNEPRETELLDEQNYVLDTREGQNMTA